MHRGEIVSAPFVFSDQRGWKARPVCIVSTAAYNAGPDVLVAMVTSSEARMQRPGLGDVVLRDWEEAGLPRPSVLRAAKLRDVERRLVGIRFGTLSDYDAAAVDEALRAVLELP